MSPARTALAALAALALATTALGCSSDDEPGGGGEATTTAAADPGTDDGPSDEQPAGPAATVDRALTEGSTFLGSSRAIDLEGAGYVQEEWQLSGTATSYAGDQPGDGAWDLAPSGEEGDYVTRVVVRRPADPADANGVVLVEWLNVSGGVDADPDFGYLAEEILRSGTTWVGVSAQHIGIEGGPTAVSIGGADGDSPLAGIQGKGLKGIDPDRYGELSHPGDAFAYDLFTQVARTVRDQPDELLGGVDPTAVVAVGESQSGFALTTYANGVQPLTEAFDGFFIHSRGGAALPLEGDQPGFDIAGALGGEPTTIRSDLAVPVLMFETESDVAGPLDFLPARQDDTDDVRTWEVAGTAHVDRFLLGPIADSAGCVPAVNDGPQHLVAKAGLRALTTWVTEGTPPPEGAPLEVDDEGAYVRDDDGIVEGGIRTPLVDVPVDVLSGEAPPDAAVFCLLAGTTTPLPADELAERYGSAEEYLAAFEAAADEAIAAGFVLAEDREALLEMAQPDRLGG